MKFFLHKTPMCFFGFGVVGVVAFLFSGHSFQEIVSSSVSNDALGNPAAIVELPRQKPEKREVKGVYLPAHVAANPDALARTIDLLDATELNAVVIDIKDYSGFVSYESAVPLVVELGTWRKTLGTPDDVRALLETLHTHDIYAIARQTVFQDSALAERRHDVAFLNTSGGLWRDNLGLAWLNPEKPEVWEYTAAIAKEAIDLGFDEVQFDYVRFPSDGNLKTLVFTHGDRDRHDVMREFFSFISDALSDEPGWISFDLFGFVMERHNGLSIGQRLEDAVGFADYLSPMMYPSHYPNGHLGLANPAAFPSAVINHGMQAGMPYVASSTRTQFRPWLQAFHIGAYYDATKIRAQIDAVETYSDGGWLLWNPLGRYITGGVQSEL